MHRQLAIINIEDTVADSEELYQQLRPLAANLTFRRIASLAELEHSLRQQAWDVIIADYNTLSVDTQEALAVTKSLGLDIPFLVLSSTAGEETAVAIMRAYDLVVETLSREARRIFGARDCTLYLLSPDGQYLIMQHLTLDQAMLRRIEQIIGITIPRIRIPIRAGSFVAQLLNTPAGTITTDPREIQQWISEFADTSYLPGILRRAIRALIPQIYQLLNIRSTIAVPLISNGQTVGMIDMSSSQIFTPHDLQRVHAISGQLTAAILRKRDEDALRESERRYQVLTQISPVGIFRTNAAGQVTYINPRWMEITGYGNDPDIGNAWLQTIHPEDRPRVHQQWRTAIQQQLSIHAEFRLLYADGRAIWVLGQAIPEKDFEGGLIGYVGTLTDITILKQAEQRNRTQLEQLTSLFEIHTAISRYNDYRQILQMITDHAHTQLKVDAACILLYDPQHQSLRYAAGQGFRSRIANYGPIGVSTSAAGHVILSKQSIHIRDISEATAFIDFERFWQIESFRAYYGIPLIINNEIRGVLEVYLRNSPDEAQQNHEWHAFLATLAGQAAIMIDNAMLFDSLRQSNQELIEAYDATIEGWSRALDLRDKETEGHTQRVTQLTLQLADAMKISGNELTFIRWGALLHDIGKMGIPDSILLKPGPLTDEEWVIMRQHPQFAYDMLQPIPFLQQALDIPHFHHEKWDGSGYPHGLKGEQIPLAARLFAVVDVWDALRSDRPYRKGWPIETIIEYIRAGSGSHFDPQVVDLFLEIINISAVS
ncbi:MAG: hypothetical protein Fur005_37170 [Roseiflexaceae bacterium]